MPEQEKQLLMFSSDMCEDDFDDFKYNVTEVIKKLSDKASMWNILGRNMGWRHLAGEAKCRVTEYSELFKAFMPNTSEYSGTFKVYEDRIEVVLYHHDAPVGEFYTMTPVKGEKEHGKA